METKLVETASYTRESHAYCQVFVCEQCELPDSRAEAGDELFQFPTFDNTILPQRFQSLTTSHFGEEITRKGRAPTSMPKSITRMPP